MSDDNKAGSTNPDGTGAPEQAAKGSSDGVKFDESQQSWIQRHSDEMFGKGFKRAESIADAKVAEVQGQLTAALAKVADLEKKVTTPKPSDAQPAQEPSADVKQLQARIEELSSTLTALKGEKEQLATEVKTFREGAAAERVRKAFLKAVPKGTEFFDADLAFEVAQRDFKLGFNEDGVGVVINPKTGMERLGPSGDPMTHEEFAAEFVTKQSYLVKATSQGGAGSSEARAAGQPLQKSVADMSPSEFNAYTEKVKSGQFQPRS